MRCSEPGVMALLGICHRTIHTVQRPQNKSFLLRKPLPLAPASFGERLRTARVAQGYTQMEVGHKFGVSLSTVKFWEQGRTQPTPPVRFQVESFLKDIRHPTAELPENPNSGFSCLTLDVLGICNRENRQNSNRRARTGEALARVGERQKVFPVPHPSAPPAPRRATAGSA